MNNKKRGLLVVSILVLFALAIMLHSPRKIVISTSTWPSWDLFRSVTQDRFHKFNSYMFEFEQHQNYNAALESFVSGQANLATLTIYEALLANEILNNDVQIVLLLDYTIGSDAVLSKSHITHVTDLKNKLIGTEQSTIAHYTALQIINKSGLKPNQVKLVFDTPETLVNLFETNKIDAISLYDPYIYQLKASQPGLNLIFSSKEIPNKICDVVIARKSWVNENLNAVKSLQLNWYKALKEGASFDTLANQEKYANPAYIRHANQNIFLTGNIENVVAFGTSKNPGYLFDAIKDMGRFLVEFNVLKTEPNYQDLLLWTPNVN